MGRRLNQEAAKIMKYGGISETEALKLVTINPAIMLHLGDRTGSIKAGKDADLVLWTDYPLSVYARASKTMVDGTIYFDEEQDAKMKEQIDSERNRIIANILREDTGNRFNNSKFSKTMKKQNIYFSIADYCLLYSGNSTESGCCSGTEKTSYAGRRNNSYRYR